MALSISLHRGTTKYELKAESTTISALRLPSVTPLPVIESSNPQALSLDLGQELEQILIQGMVDDISSGLNPSKADLETVCRNWWLYSNQTGGMPFTLKFDETKQYYVYLRSAEFTKYGAIEDRWNFSLLLFARQIIGPTIIVKEVYPPAKLGLKVSCTKLGFILSFVEGWNLGELPEFELGFTEDWNLVGFTFAETSDFAEQWTSPWE